MELAQIEAFLAVAEAGSITRASVRLHLSQPAVSAQVKALEETLGLALFARTARGMRLTSAGRTLRSRAEQLLEARSALLETARALRSAPGTLRFGVNANTRPEPVTALIRALVDAFPTLELSLHHGDSHEIAAGLREGRLDAGLVQGFLPAPVDLHTALVSSFAPCVVTTPALAAEVLRDGAPDWSKLAERTWACPAADACCRGPLEALFVQEGFRPRRIVEVDRQNASRALLGAGIEVGVLHDDRVDDDALVRVWTAPRRVSVQLAVLARRRREPLLEGVMALVNTSSSAEAA